MSDSPDDNLITGVCCLQTQFVEAKEVQDLIRDLPKVCSNEKEFELQQERYKKILDYYQAQPHLIDPHLTDLIQLLVNHILNDDQDQNLVHAASSFASHLVKVRGYKVVVRYLPHEVKYMEAVLGLLQKQQDSDDWETRYFLLLWLSILVLIPFHLSRFDSGDNQSLMNRILQVIKHNLNTGDKCQDAAAFLSAKFLTRPEIVTHFLPEFLGKMIVLKGCVMISKHVPGKSGYKGRPMIIVRSGYFWLGALNPAPAGAMSCSTHDFSPASSPAPDFDDLF